jgi:hypothetical protein
MAPETHAQLANFIWVEEAVERLLKYRSHLNTVAVSAKIDVGKESHG